MGDFKYKAFISYSHKDRKWTRWLHRRLETYPIPKNIIGNVTSAGTIPRRLKPIFRDREELSASNNLGEKIEAALASSKNLIIICSPAAAQSKWVNQEILTFKQNNRDAQLFSVIVDGEPYATGMPEREDEECFPPALRFEVNADGTLSDTPAEPLAADLRPHADGKRLGFLKLISGMIGVGLDDVVQRDMKRSRKRVTAITTGSLATVLAMGTLTGFALDARQKAEVAQAEAEAGRNDAEGLIEFMQTDLKNKLTPVGRLDVLDDVARKALSYYSGHDTSVFDCDISGRYARALQFSSEVNFAAGEVDVAKTNANNAWDITNKRLHFCTGRTDTFIDHSNSFYYQSYGASYGGDMDEFKAKSVSAKKLVDTFCLAMPSSEDCLKNEAYMFINLGIAELWHATGDVAAAKIYFEKAISNYEETQGYIDNKFLDRSHHADAHGWLAEAYLKLDQKKEAIKTRREGSKLFREILSHRELSFKNSEIHLLANMNGSQLGLARALLSAGDGEAALMVLDETLPHANYVIKVNPNSHDAKVFKLWLLTARVIAHHINGQEVFSCAALKRMQNYQAKTGLDSKISESFATRLDIKINSICNMEKLND